MQCPHQWQELGPAPGDEAGGGATLHALLHLIPQPQEDLKGDGHPSHEQGWPAERGHGTTKLQCSLFQYCYMGK